MNSADKKAYYIGGLTALYFLNRAAKKSEAKSKELKKVQTYVSHHFTSKKDEIIKHIMNSSPEPMVQSAYENFKNFTDTPHHGSISTVRFSELCHEVIAGMVEVNDGLSVPTFNRQLSAQSTMDDDVINRWLHFFSQGESSTVDFLSFMERASLLIYGDRHEQMSALFSVYDIDHNGQISTRELSHMLSCMNPNADKADTERNIMDLMRKADENHDGGLTKAEFLKLSLQGDWPRLFLPSNSEFLRAFLLKFGMCVQE